MILKFILFAILAIAIAIVGIIYLWGISSVYKNK